MSDLYVETAGTGSPALVLVHAAIADRRMWDREFADLARDHRGIRYDVRGMGRSPDPVADFYHHDDLLGVMDHVGVDTAVLIGASNGGRIALDAAATAPERVLGMVLVDSALPGVPLGDAVVADLAAEDTALEADDIDTALAINLRWFVDGVGRDRAAVDAQVRTAVTGWLRELLPRQAARARGAFGESQLLEPLVRDRLPTIEVPTLVVVGRNDAPGMDVIAQRLVADLPDAVLVEIDDAAHLPNLEQPEVFAGALGDFLTRFP